MHIACTNSTIGFQDCQGVQGKSEDTSHAISHLTRVWGPLETILPALQKPPINGLYPKHNTQVLSVLRVVRNGLCFVLGHAVSRPLHSPASDCMRSVSVVWIIDYIVWSDTVLTSSRKAAKGRY